MTIKCVVIGAGSIFALRAAADLMQEPGFAGSTLALVDVDKEALNLAARTARRMVAQAGFDLTILATADRREVLPNADFVLNTISAGEPWARERDVEIGEKHGIYQPTSQTVGPAGFMRGLRVVPHADAIAQDVAALCPEAMVLDLANPLAAVCHAMSSPYGLTVVGLCEQWAYTMPVFAEVLGVPEEELTCNAVGTNHLTWALGLYHDGQDVLPTFLDRLYSSEGAAMRARLPVSCEMYEWLGLWPTGTEAHIAEFFNHFLTPATRGGADYGLEIRHTSQADWRERMAQRRGWADGSLPVDDLLSPSGESAVPIMAALRGLRAPLIEIVNVPNGGLIDNVPAEAYVELPAYISPAGVQGLQVGPLPEPIAHIVRTRALQQQLLVEAGVLGDAQRALQGLLLDEQVNDLRTAKALWEASLEANKKWLPAFA